MEQAVTVSIELDYPRKDGTTLRQHLESYCKQSGTWDERLNPPDIHPAVSHLWEWFWAVIGGKGEDGFWSCLQAWATMTGTQLTRWESEVLARLHSVYQKAIDGKMRQ